MATTTHISDETKAMKDVLLETALECYRRGPSWAQELVVLNKTAKKLGIMANIRLQQELLNLWQGLFRDGHLVWGYDVGNPSHPYFHFSEWVDHQDMDLVQSHHE